MGTLMQIKGRNVANPGGSEKKWWRRTVEREREHKRENIEKRNEHGGGGIDESQMGFLEVYAVVLLLGLCVYKCFTCDDDSAMPLAP